MTLIEVLLIGSVLSVGVVVGYLAFPSYGFVGALGLGVGAIAVSVAGHWAIATTLALLWPVRPTCRRGKCRARDYRALEARDDGFVFECACGDTYLLERGRRSVRFMEVLPNGRARPFASRKLPGGRWHTERDDAEHEAGPYRADQQVGE